MPVTRASCDRKTTAPEASCDRQMTPRERLSLIAYTYMRLLVRQGLTSRVQQSSPVHRLCSMILPVYDFIQKKMSESQTKAGKREFKCLAHDQQRLFSCLCSKVTVYMTMLLFFYYSTCASDI